MSTVFLSPTTIPQAGACGKCGKIHTCTVQHISLYLVVCIFCNSHLVTSSTIIRMHNACGECARAFALQCLSMQLCICYSMLQGNCFLLSLLHTVTCTCSQTTVTVTVLSVILSLVLALSLSTCTVSAVVSAVMYKRLQRCRAELRGGELCSTPQLSQSLL